MQSTNRNPIKDRRLAEASEAKRVATETWRELSHKCVLWGLTLRRVTDAHYILGTADKWLDVYVGSRKIVMHGWEGHLELPRNWLLADVVAAVIEQLEGENGNGN